MAENPKACELGRRSGFDPRDAASRNWQMFCLARFLHELPPRRELVVSDCL